jgi:hypothetical protein
LCTVAVAGAAQHGRGASGRFGDGQRVAAGAGGLHRAVGGAGGHPVVVQLDQQLGYALSQPLGRQLGLAHRGEQVLGEAVGHRVVLCGVANPVGAVLAVPLLGLAGVRAD